MIVPMVIAKKNDYLKIFIIATLFSTLGGVLGYFIGFIFFRYWNELISFYGYEDKVLSLKNNLTKGTGFYIWLATLFLAGFTPLPFKVFTITSGMIVLIYSYFFYLLIF